jgi:hypothetical protein
MNANAEHAVLCECNKQAVQDGLSVVALGATPGRRSVDCLGGHWLLAVQSTAILSSQTDRECTGSHSSQ